MKRVLITTLLLTSFTVLFTQPAKVEIVGKIDAVAVDNFIARVNCQNSTRDYPSPMALRVVRQIIDNIRQYESFGVLMGQDGYEEKVNWIISHSPSSGLERAAVWVNVQTNSEWLGNLIGQYLHEYANDVCLNWHSLIRRNSNAETVVYQGDPSIFEGKSLPKSVANYYASPFASRGVGEPQSGGTPENAAMLPTSRYVLPTYLFRDISLVGQAASLFSTALNNCNYRELKYFEYANGGFEIFTKIEEVDKLTGAHLRWVNANVSTFSLTGLIETVRSLLFEDEGLYRMFIIKYDPDETYFYDSRNKTTQNVQAMYNTGSSGISSQNAQKRLAFSTMENSKVSFLVYEFEYSSQSSNIRLILDKNYMRAREHLEKTFLWSELHRLTNSRP